MPRSRCRSSTASNKGYAWSIEYTDDPHPRNTYWEMFGNPMFDLQDAAGVMLELKHCRKTFPNHYIRLMAFDSTRGVESIAMSFIVNRPDSEPGFGLRAPGRSTAARCATRSRGYAHRPARRRALRQPLKRRARRAMSQPLYAIPGAVAAATRAACRATSGRAHRRRGAGAQPGARR